MEIVLKSIKVVKSRSEETICFTAVMYVNGSKTADVSNGGYGGSHDFDIHNTEMFKQAESYIAGLPPTDGSFGPLEMNLELFISMYVGEYLEKKEIEAEHKKMMKLCVNSLCYGKADFDNNRSMEKKEEIIRIIKKYRDTEYLNVAADEILRLFSVSGSVCCNADLIKFNTYGYVECSECGKTYRKQTG